MMATTITREIWRKNNEILNILVLKETFKVVPIFFFLQTKICTNNLLTGGYHTKNSQVFLAIICVFLLFRMENKVGKQMLYNFLSKKKHFFMLFFQKNLAFVSFKLVEMISRKKWCCAVVNFCKSCVGPFVFLGNVSLLFLWDLHDAISHANWSQFFFLLLSRDILFEWGPLWIQATYDKLTNNVTFLQFKN